MDDYISRQAAINTLIRESQADGAYGYLDTKSIVDALERMPSADAVEVVRCKDCIHYMPYDWMFSEVRQSENIEDYPQDEIGCEWIDHHINPEGYCSYGERRGR